MDYITMLDDLFSKYSSLKDNEPCLCGSGKPFKYCHKLSDLQRRVDLYNTQKELLKIFKKKVCYFQDGKCSKVKTASHSIPRSSLKTIAEDNHVLCFKMLNVAELSKTPKLDQISPVEIGINEASRFHGFCNYHDNLLFEPIEKKCFESTHQQDCLLFFRALCKELYTSTEVLKVLPIHRKLIETKKDMKYRHVLNVNNILLFLCRHKSVSEILKTYNQAVSDIRSKSFNGYSSITIVTEHSPPINNCSYVNPPFFLNGEVYQDYNDLSVDLESFSFTVFSAGKNGIFHFCWPNEANFSEFFDCMLRIEKDKLADLLIQMAFMYSENVVFSKIWWEGLHLQKREHLQKIFFADVINQPFYSNPAENLCSMGFSDMKILDVKIRM